MDKILSLINISKKYNHGNKNIYVLKNISLNLKTGDILGVIGPSGCGKTTLLKIISNLEKYNKGTIQRNYEKIGFVFQDISILPWLDVFNNVKLILKNSDLINDKKVDKNKLEKLINKKIIDILKTVGLEESTSIKAGKLSGGMKRRLELARALIIEPDLILFDEPLSNIDYFLKHSILKDIKRNLNQSKKSAIYVTHDIREALFICNRLIVMSRSPSVVLKEINNIQKFSSEQILKIEQDILNIFVGENKSLKS